jgi:hypothetical protein
MLSPISRREAWRSKHEASGAAVEARPILGKSVASVDPRIKSEEVVRPTIQPFAAEELAYRPGHGASCRLAFAQLAWRAAFYEPK